MILCPDCGNKLGPSAAACACGWRAIKKTISKAVSYDSTCEWDDHGHRCGQPGVASPTTGGGNWYCREHYAKIRGRPWPDRLENYAAKSYRDRWYAEHKLAYVPPFVGHVPGFICVGQDVKVVIPDHTKPIREPGEDSYEDVYGESK
jgi:hypothetical protein